MRYHLLGRSGLRVSEICLGTMTFGEEWRFGASKEESRRIFDAFCDAGGNFVDTANTYTFGASEKFVGEFIAADREFFVLSTKYSLNTRPDDLNSGGNHRKNMLRAIENSLKQLGTDFIDIYWLHAWDSVTPVEEIMRGLEDLVRTGKVRYIGVSDTPAWVVSRANTLADLRGWTSFTGLQTEYSLIERTAERELLPMANSMGLGVLAWAPLGGGLLTGKYVLAEDTVQIDDTKRGTWLNSERLTRRSLQIAACAAAVATELGRHPAQVALNWLRQRSGIIPIVAGRTLGQMQQNLGCLDFMIETTHVEQLDKASSIELGFPHRFLSSAPLLHALWGNKRELLSTTPGRLSPEATRVEHEEES